MIYIRIYIIFIILILIAMEYDSLYNYILETFYNQSSNQPSNQSNTKKKKENKTVLFANIVVKISDIVKYKNGNPASARIHQHNFQRLFAMLNDYQRKILLIKLILYIYIMPFIRYSSIAFLVLFRFYHIYHPEFITARINNSPSMSRFWSNYYPIGIYHNNSNNTVNNNYLTNRVISIRKQLNKLSNDILNIRELGINTNRQYKSIDTMNAISTNTINSFSTKTKLPIEPKTSKSKTKSKSKKELLKKKEKLKTTKEYDPNIKGFILPDKNLVAIIENGIVYLYPIPKYLRNKYNI